MNLVSKAIWYIETRLTREISLVEIAAACEVSQFHLSRAFGRTTGRPVMRYVRGRRLTEAARVLCLHSAGTALVGLSRLPDLESALTSVAKIMGRYSDGDHHQCQSAHKTSSDLKLIPGGDHRWA